MRERLPSFKSCFLCGSENARGMGITYHYDSETGFVVGSVQPEDCYCGYPGMLHGGLQAALLDDALYWAASHRSGLSSVTLELTTRFRRPARLGQAFRLAARCSPPEGRKIAAEGRLEDGEGNVLAEASGLYLLHPPEEYRRTIVPWLDFTGCSPRIVEWFGGG